MRQLKPGFEFFIDLRTYNRARPPAYSCGEDGIQTRTKEFIRFLLLTLCVVAIPAGTARADMSSDAQMRMAMRAIDVLAGVTAPTFERKDGALQATVTRNGKTATLVGFIPGRKSSQAIIPVLALVMPKMNLGDFLGTAMDAAFKNLALTDVTILLKARKDRRATIPLSTLPKILGDSIGTMASDVSLDFGIEIFGRMAGKPKGAMPEALKLISLTRFDDISMRAAMKQPNVRLTLKKDVQMEQPVQPAERSENRGKTDRRLQGL